MTLAFEWDDANRKHLALHGISPEEAEWALAHSALRMGEDVRNAERRLKWLGAANGRVLLLITTETPAGAVRVVTGWAVGSRLSRFWHTVREADQSEEA